MSHFNAESEISAQVAAIHGWADDGAAERVITIVDDDVVICVLRGELLLGEREHVPGGNRDAAMRAAVERITGRTVATIATDTHRDPDITLLTFTFAPVIAARRLLARD